MRDEFAPPPPERPSYFKNWLSLTGAITATGGMFAFVFLVAIDTFAHETNPYIGILTYLVAPVFLILGLAMVFAGWWVQRRQAARRPVAGGSQLLAIDLSRPSHRRYLAIFGSGALLFLLLYNCARYVAHERALASLDARLYHGSAPSRVAAARVPYRRRIMRECWRWQSMISLIGTTCWTLI